MYCIKKVQVELKNVLFNKSPTVVLVKYFNYNNIFLIENKIKLLKHLGINCHIIKIQKSKQLFFK